MESTLSMSASTRMQVQKEMTLTKKSQKHVWCLLFVWILNVDKMPVVFVYPDSCFLLQWKLMWTWRRSRTKSKRRFRVREKLQVPVWTCSWQVPWIASRLISTTQSSPVAFWSHFLPTAFPSWPSLVQREDWYCLLGHFLMLPPISLLPILFSFVPVGFSHISSVAHLLERIALRWLHWHSLFASMLGISSSFPGFLPLYPWIQCLEESKCICSMTQEFWCPNTCFRWTSHRFHHCLGNKSWKGNVCLEWCLGKLCRASHRGTQAHVLEASLVIASWLGSGLRNTISIAWLAGMGRKPVTLSWRLLLFDFIQRFLYAQIPLLHG